MKVLHQELTNEHETFWKQIISITEELNDETYQFNWKENIIKNHQISHVKGLFEVVA